MRAILAHPWFHPLLLLLWTALGLGLRFFNLAGKPLWTDEFATIVFSLGNSFLTVPLDQVLTPEQLLQPLEPSPHAGIPQVVDRLLNESNHPPLYFILTHLWLKLFPPYQGMVTVWQMRSIAALFGTLTIPATFGFARFAFRSRLVAQLSAALMAVSPFGIYLAQEARHYTLPLLLLIVSLGCLVSATRSIRVRTPLSLRICLVWLVVNALGIATHYLFILALLVEALVLLTMGLIQSWREQGQWYPSAHWWRIVTVAVGTTLAGLVWLPFLQEVQESKLTEWIQQSDRSGWEWVDPLLQALAGWISMLYLLPVQSTSRPIAILSGVILLLLTWWTLPKLIHGIQTQLKQSGARLPVLALGCYVTIAVLLFLGLTYGLGKNLTSAFRYNFVYFPAVIVLVGAALASLWRETLNQPHTEKPTNTKTLIKLLWTGNIRTVVMIGLLSLLGGLTVVTNLGYQKTHRPDLVAQDIREQSEEQVLIVIPHETHGQTGRLMGIAWELQHNPAAAPLDPRYLLAHVETTPRSVIQVLRQTLNQYSRPLDLWLINMRDVPDAPLATLLKQQQCSAITKNKAVDGYRYRLYRCSN